MATGAPSADDLLTRMNTIAPPGGSASSSATQTSAPSSDDLLTRMNTIAPPPATTQTGASEAAAKPAGYDEAYGMTAPAFAPGTTGTDIANAFQAGTYRGLASVVNAPSAWFGWKPLVDTNALLAPSETQAAQAHPNVAGAGQLFGQAVGTSPLALVTPGAAVFEGIGLGGAGWAPAVARGALTGAGYGAAGGILTAGEDPQQSLVGRALTGAGMGALLGGMGGGVAAKVGDWLAPDAAAGTNALDTSVVAPTPRFTPSGPVTLDQLTAAVQRATPESWRPVAPGEDYVPGAQYRMNQATGQREVNVGGPAPTAPAAPSVAQSAGAQATPSGAAQMTPEEIATQRTVADKQWLNRTVQPGVQDTTADIPGITQSLVEQEQTVQRARELKALKNLNPALSQNEREILDLNNDIRQRYYGDTVGSDVTRAADLKTANDKINTDLATVWRGKGEADPTNVQSQIQTELAGSAGELPPLKSAMKQVGDSLEAAGDDPQAMYRTHRLINYLQSKQGQLANPGYGSADVQAALTRVKGTLAKTIDDAAPGFSRAMSDYAAARGPIDAAKALQERENGLYDSQGRMQFLPVHKLMRDIIEAQKWDAPTNPLAGVSEGQMARLKTLHDNLKRVASAKDLAAAAGSDTAMNAVDIAKEYARGIGGAAVHGVANLALGPGLGSMAVRGVRTALNPLLSARAARQQMQRGMEILRPPPSSNPLTPP